MGAKKKGGLANKLAKMTDEERAKYLQRKADMEEEARRRKEQLIATFMKNKLRKEDAFSRLNIAKINQNWHQTMRSNKCQEMKAEVENLRRWIDRTVTLKNRTIKKLMEELDWQEDLYGKNFHAHSDHVDRIIDFHNKNLEEVCQQYQDDRVLLLHVTGKERQGFETRAETELEHLKTIIHAQQIEAETLMRNTREEHMKRADEILSTYRTELNLMRKSRERISCALWRQMCHILKTYLQQTELKRSHLAELKRLDVEGALVIAKDQQHIQHQEAQIGRLKEERATLAETREEQVAILKGTLESTSEGFFGRRRLLLKETKRDEKQLGLLSDVSNAAIKGLEALVAKGDQILTLIQTCAKLETEEEKLNRWAPMAIEEESESKTSLQELMAPPESSNLSLFEEEERPVVARKARPLTAVPKSLREKQKLRQLRSEEQTRSEDRIDEVFEISTRLIKTAKAKKKSKTKSGSAVVFARKSSLEFRATCFKPRPVSAAPKPKPKKREEDLDSLLESINVAETGFEGLEKLEGLWCVHNKVEIDCMDLRKEKKALMEENEKLKEVMRDVLAAAALGQSIPSAKSSSTAASRRRFILSAPMSPLIVL